MSLWNEFFFPTSRPTIVPVSVFWKRTENLATVTDRHIIILCMWRFHFLLFIYFFTTLRRRFARRAAFLVRQTSFSTGSRSEYRTFHTSETLTWRNRCTWLIFHGDRFFLFYLGTAQERKNEYRFSYHSLAAKSISLTPSSVIK